MTSKNDLLITHSCLDCQICILSDVHLEVLDVFDWQLLVFLERYKGRGRPLEYSVIAFLRALVYMELSGVTSVFLAFTICQITHYSAGINSDSGSIYRGL